MAMLILKHLKSGSKVIFFWLFSGFFSLLNITSEGFIRRFVSQDKLQDWVGVLMSTTGIDIFQYFIPYFLFVAGVYYAHDIVMTKYREDAQRIDTEHKELRALLNEIDESQEKQEKDRQDLMTALKEASKSIEEIEFSRTEVDIKLAEIGKKLNDAQAESIRREKTAKNIQSTTRQMLAKWRAELLEKSTFSG